MNNHTNKFIRFASVGALGTALHYIVLISLVEIMQVNAVAATSAGFIVGAIFNYLMSFKLVFCSKKKHTDTMPKFITIAAITGILNSIIMWSLAEKLSLYYLAAQVIATGAAFIANYFLNSNWTFR